MIQLADLFIETRFSDVIDAKEAILIDPEYLENEFDWKLMEDLFIKLTEISVTESRCYLKIDFEEDEDGWRSHEVCFVDSATDQVIMDEIELINLVSAQIPPELLSIYAPQAPAKLILLCLVEIYLKIYPDERAIEVTPKGRKFFNNLH